jgi:hypothetical protein
MQRQTMRNNKWQAAINLAAELDAARRQNLEVHYAELNARSDSAIAQRDQARQAKCHQLREHFQKVMDTAEWKKKDEALQSWQKAEWLQEMMKRSDRHMEACRVQYEVRMEEKRQTVVEREHEVLRVARMNKYMQQQQQQENDEDAEIFAECVRMRDAIPQRIAERIGEVPC